MPGSRKIKGTDLAPRLISYRPIQKLSIKLIHVRESKLSGYLEDEHARHWDALK